MILSFFLLQIIRIYTENFNNYCFTIIGYFQTQLNIPFHKDLPFVPDVLKLKLLLKEYTFDSEVGVLRKESYILEKADHPCSEPLVYPVPESQYPILTLETNILWGNDYICLDYQKMIIKPDFVESFHIVQGVGGNILMRIFLKHYQKHVLHIHEPHSHRFIDYNKKVRDLLPGEKYCMSFFTKEFKKIWVFSKPPILDGNAYEYQILIARIDRNLAENVFMENILTRIYPCMIPSDFDEPFQIFIDLMTHRIHFELFYKNTFSYYTSDYFGNSSTVISYQRHRNFDIYNLEVKRMPVTQELIDRNPEMLLYVYKPFLKFCNTRIPEDISGLELSLISMKKFNGAVQHTVFQYVDMSTQELKIFRMRTGTKEEYDKCMTE